MANGNNAGAIGMTTIGPTIIIRGRLKVDENLTVKGRIDAEISSSKALIIETSGIIKADVRVQSARISGVLVGNIIAEEKIEITPHGRVVGDLRAPRIVISDGAAFRGKIDMQSFAEPQPSADAAPASAMTVVPATTAEPLTTATLLPDAVTLAQPARAAPKAGRRH